MTVLRRPKTMKMWVFSLQAGKNVSLESLAMIGLSLSYGKFPGSFDFQPGTRKNYPFRNNNGAGGTKLRAGGTDSGAEGTKLRAGGTDSGAEGTKLRAGGTDDGAGGTKLRAGGTDDGAEGTKLRVGGTDDGAGGT
jgi:hypothetical protein